MARATIDEVAAAAGVGRSTVSRVLNGSPAVSPEARAAVEQAIVDLNYAPSRAARSLALKHAHALALIVPEDLERFFGDPFFAEVMTGITRRLQESDYVLNLMVASGPADGAAARKVSSFVRNGGVDGAFVISHHTGDTFLEQIAKAIPVVFGGRPDPLGADASVYFVDADNEEGAYRATQHLIDTGRTRIATITGPQNMTAAQERLDGFRRALAGAGLEPAAIVVGDYSAASGADAARELLASGASFDAIFIANDLMAIAAMRVLQAAGLSVPGDVAIVGFDDAAVAAQAEPALTTVRQPLRSQGEAMADVMLRALAGEHPPAETILPTSLIVRETA